MEERKKRASLALPEDFIATVQVSDWVKIEELKGLRELRTQSGKTQKQLAGIIGVSQSTISFWEQGKFEPSLQDTVKTAEALNVSIDTLVRGMVNFRLGDNG